MVKARLGGVKQAFRPGWRKTGHRVELVVFQDDRGAFDTRHGIKPGQIVDNVTHHPLNARVDMGMIKNVGAVKKKAHVSFGRNAHALPCRSTDARGGSHVLPTKSS